MVTRFFCGYTDNLIYLGSKSSVMKVSKLVLFFMALCTVSYAQHYDEEYTVDVFGNLRYESRNQFQASLSTNVFGDKIYKDNRGNEVKYSKALVEKVPVKERPGFDDYLFIELIHRYQNQRNMKEEFEEDIFGNTRYRNNRGQSVSLERDIFGHLQYSRDGFRASLKKDIFDNVIYEDNRGNKVTYSKDFVRKMFVKDVHGEVKHVEEFLLLGLAKDVGRRKNYTEEYDVDIFGNVEYENSEGRRITVKKDIFDGFEYKDNQGLSLSIRKDIFNNIQITDSKGGKVSVERDIFGDLQVKDNKGNRWSIERDIFGDLKFRSNHKENATLKKNIFDEREYSDSKGNKVKYSPEAWEKLMKRFGGDEAIFKALLNRFFGK